MALPTLAVLGMPLFAGAALLGLPGAPGAQTAELAKLAPGVTFDHVGTSVSAWGGRALVGAPSLQSFERGAAYLYERAASGEWLLAAKLVPSVVESWPFGECVSLSGDLAAVGAPQEDAGVPAGGVVYVFERQASGAWLEAARLTPDDASASDSFGWALSLEGDRLLVGAPLDDPLGTNSGAAYVFERDEAGAWIQVAKLVPSQGGDLQTFGSGLSLSGERVLISARCSDDCSSFSPPRSGLAYVFERRGDGRWLEVASLRPVDGTPQDGFALSSNALALSGERALIGATQDPTMGPEAGAAYVFERRADGAWEQAAKLLGSATGAREWFGYSAALEGQRAVVGAVLQDPGGAAYWFERREDGSWRERALLEASDSVPGQADFGTTIALAGDRVLVGDPRHGGSGFQAGAGYLFDLLPLSSPLAPASLAPASLAPASLAPGEVLPLELDAGRLHPGEAYWLLGSASGSEPGIPLPGGLTLPLNPDAYLRRTLELPGQPPLFSSFGLLNAYGHADAAFVAVPSDLSLVGTTLHHAFVTLTPAPLPMRALVTFASNALPLVLAHGHPPLRAGVGRRQE